MKPAQEWAEYAQQRGIVGAAEREYLASLIVAIQRDARRDALVAVDKVIARGVETLGREVRDLIDA